MMDTFFGIKILPSEHVQPVPVLQLHPDFPWCTPEFRAKTNAWLLERFGTMEVAYMFDPRALGLAGSPGFLMNPKHVAMLKMYSRDVTR
jgi:hypothetical protein